VQELPRDPPPERKVKACPARPAIPESGDGTLRLTLVCELYRIVISVATDDDRLSAVAGMALTSSERCWHAHKTIPDGEAGCFDDSWIGAYPKAHSASTSIHHSAPSESL